MANVARRNPTDPGQVKWGVTNVIKDALKTYIANPKILEHTFAGNPVYLKDRGDSIRLTVKGEANEYYDITVTRKRWWSVE